MKAQTRGGIVLEDIEIGDIHYEYSYGTFIKVKVLTKPEVEDGVWRWKDENLSSEGTIDYVISESNNHYGPNLYDHEAYFGCRELK